MYFSFSLDSENNRSEVEEPCSSRSTTPALEDNIKFWTVPKQK